MVLLPRRVIALQIRDDLSPKQAIFSTFALSILGDFRLAPAREFTPFCGRARMMCALFLISMSYKPWGGWEVGGSNRALLPFPQIFMSWGAEILAAVNLRTTSTSISIAMSVPWRADRVATLPQQNHRTQIGESVKFFAQP